MSPKKIWDWLSVAGTIDIMADIGNDLIWESLRNVISLKRALFSVFKKISSFLTKFKFCSKFSNCL